MVSVMLRSANDALRLGSGCVAKEIVATGTGMVAVYLQGKGMG